MLVEQDVLRPEPSQYESLVLQTERLVTGVLAIASVQSMVTMLSAKATALEIGTDYVLLLNQARSLDSVTTAWSKSMDDQYPLYSDILSPFSAAISDLRRGLQLLCVAIELRVSTASAGCELSQVTASCLAFPMHLGTGDSKVQEGGSHALLSASELSSSGMRNTICSSISVSILDAITNSAGAVAPATLQTLPTTLSLHLKLRGLIAACHACVPLSDLAAVRPVIVRTHDVLTSVADLWRRGRDLQAELARREDALFKTNAQRERVFTLTEEEEDEDAFRKDHKNMTTAFADLMDGPPDDCVDDDMLPLDMINDDEASMAAVSRKLVSTLEDPMIQCSIVGLHMHVSNVFHNDLIGPVSAIRELPDLGLQTVAGHASALADVAYELGAMLLQSQSGYVEAWVDEASCCGALRQLLKQLEVTRVEARSGSRDSVDVSEPCVSEAILAVDPVSLLLARMDMLLARFPDQPMLLQIQMICSRILGMLLPVEIPAINMFSTIYPALSLFFVNTVLLLKQCRKGHRIWMKIYRRRLPSDNDEEIVFKLSTFCLTDPSLFHATCIHSVHFYSPGSIHTSYLN